MCCAVFFLVFAIFVVRSPRIVLRLMPPNMPIYICFHYILVCFHYVLVEFESRKTKIAICLGCELQIGFPFALSKMIGETRKYHWQISCNLTEYPGKKSQQPHNIYIWYGRFVEFSTNFPWISRPHPFGEVWIRICTRLRTSSELFSIVHMTCHGMCSSVERAMCLIGWLIDFTRKYRRKCFDRYCCCWCCVWSSLLWAFFCSIFVIVAAMNKLWLYRRKINGT